MQKMFWRETEHKKTLNGQQILKLKRRESEQFADCQFLERFLQNIIGIKISYSIKKFVGHITRYSKKKDEI